MAVKVLFKRATFNFELTFALTTVKKGGLISSGRQYNREKYNFRKLASEISTPKKVGACRANFATGDLLFYPPSAPSTSRKLSDVSIPPSHLPSFSQLRHLFVTNTMRNA